MATVTRIRIVIDDDYQPEPETICTGKDDRCGRYAGHDGPCDWCEGDLTPYGVILEAQCSIGGWHSTDSVWGCVTANGLEGTYATSADVPDDHLREIAEDMAG